jgi:hypothetical protein
MSLDSFNPNLVPRLNTWATYIPGRTTKKPFSTHRIAAHAKSALKASHTGIIYEYVNEEWVERYKVTEEDYNNRKCMYCGKEESRGGGWPNSHYLSNRWVPGEWRIEWSNYNCKRNSGEQNE